MPFLQNDRKYRAFQISGDSMLPIPDKAYGIGEYVEDFSYVKDQYPYIFLTRDDGIVFKVAENRPEEEEKLVLHSLNPLYEPFEVLKMEIREVWKFVNFINHEMPEPNAPKEELISSIKSLQKQVRSIQTKLNLDEQ
jgi:phage repressor protein C with HTH and peptisase S24 domain